MTTSGPGKPDTYATMRWAPLERLADAFDLNFTPEQLAALAADAENMTAGGIDSDAWILVATAIGLARGVEVDHAATTRAMRRLDGRDER